MKQVASFTCPAVWQHCILAQSDDHFAFDSRLHNSKAAISLTPKTKKMLVRQQYECERVQEISKSIS